MRDTSILADPFPVLPPHAPEDVNELLQWAVCNCARAVEESFAGKAEALILTGSMARGEASVLRAGAGVRCLSDMEFLVAVPDRREWKENSRTVDVLTERVTREAADRGLECEFEFTLAPRCYFPTVRPSIFAHELRRHGKTVWGDPSCLEAMQDFPADRIPKIDALYLVCNRMVEQLAWWSRISADENAEADGLFAYGLVKTYVDLGTSLLIFAGDYASTYAERAERMAALRDALWGQITEIGPLLDRIAESSQAKLQPEPELFDRLPKDAAMGRWKELARCVLQVWQWELRQLDAGANAADDAEQVARFARSGDFRDRLREWAKLARSAGRNKLFSDLARATYLSGSPRNRLYAESAVAYAKLAGLEAAFPIARPREKSFLPIRPRAEGSTEDRVAEILRIWKMYFRNN